MSDFKFQKCGVKNAIQQAIYGVAFQDVMDEETLSTFTNPNIISDLPRIDKHIGSDVTISVDETGAQFTAPSASTLSRVERKVFDSSGNLRWMFVADNNRILVSCFQYNGWAETKPFATKIILEAFESANLMLKRPHSVVCNIIDEFWWLDSKSVMSGQQLIDGSSPFVASHGLSTIAGYFHSYSGWFERDDEARQRLVRIHIDGAPANMMQSTPPAGARPDGVKIDNFIQTYLDSNDAPLSKRLEIIFDQAHDRNLQLMRSVLTAPAKQSIGLAE